MMVKSTSRSEINRKNRAAGARFEERVCIDLEKKGWICSRWMKNVVGQQFHDRWLGKLIPARPKIRMIPGKGPILLGVWTGFPDFIACRSCQMKFKGVDLYPTGIFENQGVECKSNGNLDKEEKEKCRWLLANNIFSSILVAKKGEKRGSIIYEEFK